LPELSALRTFFFCLLPGLFWLVYLRSLSGGRVPPWWQWAVAFLAGLGSVKLTLLASESLGVTSLERLPYLGSLVYFVVGVGLVEEGAKALCAIVALKIPGFCRRPLLSIQLCGGVALGFATAENLVYAGHYGDGVLLGRFVFSTLAHILFASVWGFGLGVREVENGQTGSLEERTDWWQFLWLVVVSAVAHGVYDWFLVSGRPVLAILTLVVLWVGFRESILGAYLHQEYSRALPFETRPCPVCSVLTRANGSYCSYCGVSLGEGGEALAKPG